MPTAWNPSDAGAGLTFDNDNRTAFFIDTNVRSVRATTAKTTGKWYYECRAPWTTPTIWGGVMTSGGSLVFGPGVHDNMGYGVRYSVGDAQWRLSNNSFDDLIGGTGGLNSILGVCLDLVNQKFFFRVDGVNVLGFPESNSGGYPLSVQNDTWYAATGGTCSTPGSGANLTASFGSQGLRFPPPAGFSAWDQQPVSLGVNTQEAAIRRVMRTVGI